MLSIGIGEIQKKSFIFSSLTEAMQIVDKRKKRILAMVYPVQNESMVDTLAGKYKNRVMPTQEDIESIKEKAMSLSS